MGKWCKVKCNCPNRQPLLGSNWTNYNDYQKYQQKPRLAKTIEEWEHDVKAMYECGHQDGNLIQFWQGDILKFGYTLETSFKKQSNQFEIFRRISNWQCYDDEYLFLIPSESTLWKLEIKQLKRFILGEEFLGWGEKEVFDRELSEYSFLYGDINGTLQDALKLCEASEKTNNPIEFFW